MMLFLDIVIGLLAFVGLSLLALTVRRMVLSRPVGTFACSLRLGEHPAGEGWSYGIGRYHGDPMSHSMSASHVNISPASLKATST